MRLQQARQRRPSEPIPATFGPVAPLLGPSASSLFQPIPSIRPATIASANSSPASASQLNSLGAASPAPYSIPATATLSPETAPVPPTTSLREHLVSLEA